MKDQVKKALFAGIGVASYAFDKASEIAKELKEEFDLTEEEGAKLSDELKDRVNKEKERIESIIDERIEKVITKLKLATKADIENLKQEIETLKEE